MVDEPMRAYYEQRAQEYDDWWLGTGLVLSRDRPGWHAEVDKLVAAVGALVPARVLDVACGTGFLTQHLQGEVIGLDQSAAMADLAAARVSQAQFVKGEAVPLPFGDAEFDRVDERATLVREQVTIEVTCDSEARRVGRELVVVDSARREAVPAEEWQERALNDGSRHRVFKRFFTGAARSPRSSEAETFCTKVAGSSSSEADGERCCFFEAAAAAAAVPFRHCPNGREAGARTLDRLSRLSIRVKRRRRAPVTLTWRGALRSF